MPVIIARSMITDSPKRNALLALSGLGALLLLATFWLTLISKPVKAAQDENPADEALVYALAMAGPDDIIDAVIYVESPYVLEPLDLPDDKLTRRRTVAMELRDNGLHALEGLTERLEAALISENVSSYRPLWIVNAVQVSAKKETILELLKHPDVRKIILDKKIQLLETAEVVDAQSPVSLTWGLAQIRTSHVWYGLGIDGNDVTVAIMDTGVDSSHPDLKNNYRGNGATNQEGSWFDAVDASPVPNDPNGHGTHVAGTSVGMNGIGVAPGADWIGVRILDADGYGQIGDIHAGFQWLLAPNGDPTLSPDIVNNSWSGGTELVEFMPDVNALKAAGIIAVYATGNSGPFEGSVGAPASYPGTVAVGASDDTDQYTWFSGRGPSPHTEEPKPTFIAPGISVISSLPDGRYGIYHGTSMATPHVVGLFALLLSAQPHLSEIEATAIISSTSIKIGSVQPSPTSGWGRVDAYAAVSEVARGGGFSGTVHHQGSVIPDAAILITNSLGVGLPFLSDEGGSFKVNLAPGVYDLSVKKFGYSTTATSEITILEGETIELIVNLAKLPGGVLRGRLIDLNSLSAISGTLRIVDQPISIVIDDDGWYSVPLPDGKYEVIASAVGHRNEHLVVEVSSAIIVHDFLLGPAPRILLFDSGRWYYESQIAYIASALDDLDYGYSLWSVRDPFNDVPSVENLIGYDVIIWSDPIDSPGNISADNALWGYLEAGGNLLITGQRIGRYDGTGSYIKPWWTNQLQGEFIGFVDLPQLITGEAGTHFTDLNLELNGLDSAGNQVSLDSSEPAADSFTEVALRYGDGRPAALQNSLCQPFRIVYLGFGLEGISGIDNRKGILSSSFDYFAAPEKATGIHVSPSEWEMLVPRGSESRIEIDVLNLSESFTDTFQISLRHDDWPANVITDTLTLGACASGNTAISISIPADIDSGSYDEFELVATSSISPSLQITMPIRLKTPGEILLVDDDRWYDQQALYRALFEDLGYAYDLWDTARPPQGDGSPPEELLKQYQFIFWYTAFDWFRPINESESQSLYNYLDDGGRLFLSSQDYLYYHATDPLTTKFLGIRDYLESVEPDYVIGNPQWGMPVGPHVLDYEPYHNYSDGMVPTSSARIFSWHNRGGAAAIANSGESWRTLFWGIPFEKLPQEQQPEAMGQIMGWLSDFGDSTIESNSRVVSNFGEIDSIRTYTITLRNSGSMTTSHASITNTLPQNLILYPDSISGGATYEPTSHALSWSGALENNESMNISYLASPTTDLPVGTRIENVIMVHDTRNDIIFNRSVPIWVEESDLSSSSIQIMPENLTSGGTATIQIKLENDGYRTATISASVQIVSGLTAITPTLTANNGTARVIDNTFAWQLELAPSQIAVATLEVTATGVLKAAWLPVTLIIRDRGTDPIVRDSYLEITPYQMLFPLITNAQNP